jgi:hypothetical protein
MKTERQLYGKCEIKFKANRQFRIGGSYHINDRCCNKGNMKENSYSHGTTPASFIAILGIAATYFALARLSSLLAIPPATHQP